MAKSVTQKQEESDNRVKTYNNMSPAEKLDLIRNRRGESKKERVKILKQIKEKNNNEKNI